MVHSAFTTSRNLLIVGALDGFGLLLAGVLRGRGHRVRTESVEDAEHALAVQTNEQSGSWRQDLGLRRWLESADGAILVSGAQSSSPGTSELDLLASITAAMPIGALCTYTSSLAVFGQTGPDLIVDESITPPAVPVPLWELRNVEAWLLGRRRCRGVVVRLGYVWGVDDLDLSWPLHTVLSPSPVEECQHARFPSVRLGGLIDLVRRVVETPAARGVYHAASGSMPVRRILAPWTSAVDPLLVRSVRRGQAFRTDSHLLRARSPLDVVVDRSRAADELGWSPQPGNPALSFEPEVASSMSSMAR